MGNVRCFFSCEWCQTRGDCTGIGYVINQQLMHTEVSGSFMDLRCITRRELHNRPPFRTIFATYGRVAFMRCNTMIAIIYFSNNIPPISSFCTPSPSRRYAGHNYIHRPGYRLRDCILRITKRCWTNFYPPSVTESLNRVCAPIK